MVGRDSRRIDRTLVRSMIGGRRVLITGAGGSIGSEIARLCARFEPAELILMDRSDNALFEIDRQLASTAPDVERRVVLHDVVDLRSTAERFQALRPQVVFHAAAHKHVPLMEEHPAEALVNNFFGTRSVADASMRCGVDRFVMISTDKAVNPSSIMGATKQLAERYVRSCNGLSDTRFALVRFGNVLGSSCSVLPIWAKQISEGGPVTVTHPEMTRYFMTIPEAAALVVQSAGISIDDAASPDVFVLDMGEPVSILSLAQRLIGALGMVPSMGDDAVEGGMPIAISGIRPGEKLHEELVHAEESLDETRIPGIRAWTGECPSRADVEQMVRDMSAALGTGDAAAALGAIERYIPTISRSDSGVRESIPHPTAA
ncbi:MAG: polysaccharide biosynthesis protein [Planctomycetota bacterium]